MKTKLILALTVAMALFANLALAADVTGKWTAETKGRDGQTRTQTFNLKADGSKLTGSVSMGQMGEREISNGKVDGDNISFDVNVEMNGNAMTMKYTGTLSGDELKMKRDSQRGPQEFVAKRATT